MEDMRYQINERQLIRMIILETGTFGCLFVTMWSGRENGILTVLLSIIGSLIYGGILVAIGRTDGGFYAMTERSLSGILWRLVWLIYVIRFAIRGAWMLSFLEYLIRETLYPGGHLMILLPFLFVSVYAATRNLEGRARFVELIFWWVILPLVFIFLIGLWKTDLTVIVPVQELSAKQLIRDEYRLMALFLPLEFLLFRVSGLEGQDIRVWAAAMKGVLLSGGWILLVYIVTAGILGLSWGHENYLGVTDAMEQVIMQGGVLERLDILILLFWLVGGIVTLSAYLFQGQQLLRRIFVLRALSGSYGGTIWMVIIQTLLTVAVYCCFPSLQEWTDWYLRYACYIDVPVSIGIPVLIWIIYKLRMRWKTKHWNHRLKVQEEPVKFFLISIIFIGTAGFLNGCTKQESIENRVYVKQLHIYPTDSGYRFLCDLSYLNQDLIAPDLMETGGFDSASGSETMMQTVMEPDGKGQGEEGKQKDQEDADEQKGRENVEEQTEPESKNEQREQETVGEKKKQDNTGEQKEQRTDEEQDNIAGQKDQSWKEEQRTQGDETEQGKQGLEDIQKIIDLGNDVYEYSAEANTIREFNDAFYRLTGCRFDYSHLQGIYVPQELYQPALAGDVLDEIRQETKVVLSTPIYEEAVAVGDQKEETIGEWLKEIK